MILYITCELFQSFQSLVQMSFRSGMILILDSRETSDFSCAVLVFSVDKWNGSHGLVFGVYEQHTYITKQTKYSSQDPSGCCVAIFVLDLLDSGRFSAAMTPGKKYSGSLVLLVFVTPQSQCHLYMSWLI